MAGRERARIAIYLERFDLAQQDLDKAKALAPDEKEDRDRRRGPPSHRAPEPSPYRGPVVRDRNARGRWRSWRAHAQPCNRVARARQSLRLIEVLLCEIETLEVDGDPGALAQRDCMAGRVLSESNGLGLVTKGDVRIAE